MYDIRELEEILLSLRLELNRRISDKLERCQEKVRQFEGKLKLVSPQSQLNEKRQTAADLEDKLHPFAVGRYFANTASICLVRAANSS